MRNNSAFTLIEMLIVTAILAILASITLPLFNTQSTTAKIGSVVPILHRLSNDLLLAYGTLGHMPETLAGVSGEGANGSYGPYVVDGFTTNIRYINGSTWNNVGAMIQLNVDSKIGQGVPGFQESITGADGAYNGIAIAFIESDGGIQVYCGNWDDSNAFIPIKYLPPGCDDNNFAATVIGN